MKTIQRAESPTPKFFKAIRIIGLALATIGGALLAAPVTLPATVVTIAGYLVLSGGNVSAVSQLTTDKDGLISEKNGYQ